MSQPRRRRSRRRRRKGSAQPKQQETQKTTGQQSKDAEGRSGPTESRSSRRRRRRRGSSKRPQFKSSEDLVRSFLPAKPTEMHGQGDGTTVEEVIGDLQSEHGVPQYPQEYRITLKVAEERPANNGREKAPGNGGEVVREHAPEVVTTPEGNKREKAPAAPRMPSSSASGEGGGRRRRRRRRKRSGGSNSGGASG